MYVDESTDYSDVKAIIDNIHKEFKRLDGLLRDPSLSEEVKSSIARYVSDRKIIPRCSHQFTKYLKSGLSSSFRAQRMIDDNLINSIVGGTNPVNLKGGSKRFASCFDVKVPETFQSGVATSDVKFDFGSSIVIKPTGGSQANNVFGLVEHGTEVFDVFSKKSYPSYAEFSNQFNLRFPDTATWEVEEFIYDSSGSKLVPAYDVKFYCFYGVVALVLQVDRWGDRRLYKWYTPDKKQIDVGIYSSVSSKSTGGGGPFFPKGC